MKLLKALFLLPLRILAAPVVLALTLLVWVCTGLVYVSGYVLGAGQHGAGTAGYSRADYLLPEKRDHSAGDGVSGKPLRSAYGSFLAAGEGSALEICDSGSGVWMKFHVLLLN